MTREDAIDKLEHLINSPVGREEIDETCYEVMKYLAAQKPRVMTLEEVENAIDTVVWVDRPTTKNESKLFGLIQAYSRKLNFIQIKHIEMNMGEHMLYPYETYGKEWRCWTSRPTDEQREAIPWN